MQTNLFRKLCYYPVLMSVLLAGLGTAARSEDLPSYMEPIAGRTSSTAASIANADVLALNVSMFQLYANAGKVFRQNLMAKHPDLVAAGNIGCITQLAGDAPMPVVHAVELLDWASGGPKPRALTGLGAAGASRAETRETAPAR